VRVDVIPGFLLFGVYHNKQTNQTKKKTKKNKQTKESGGVIRWLRMRLMSGLRESGDVSQPVNLQIAYPRLDLECLRAVPVNLGSQPSQALREEASQPEGVYYSGFISLNKQTNAGLS